MDGIKISLLPALPYGTDISGAQIPASISGTTYRVPGSVLGVARFGKLGEDVSDTESREFNTSAGDLWFSVGDAIDYATNESEIYITNYGATLYSQVDEFTYTSINCYSSEGNIQTRSVLGSSRIAAESNGSDQVAYLQSANADNSLAQNLQLTPDELYLYDLNTAAMKWIPTAIMFNGGSPILADNTGLIDLGTIGGGGSSRFGVSGEDDTGAEDRNFYNASNVTNIGTLSSYIRLVAGLQDFSSNYTSFFIDQYQGSLQSQNEDSTQFTNFYTGFEEVGMNGSYNTGTPVTCTLKIFHGKLMYNSLVLGDKYIPLSVNGAFADSDGNITIDGGGGSSRFGVSGEDDTAEETRNFDANQNDFTITNIANSTIRSDASTSDYHARFMMNPTTPPGHSFEINIQSQATYGSSIQMYAFTAPSDTGARNQAAWRVTAQGEDFADKSLVVSGAGVSMSNLPTFASNSAALTGGLIAGDLYRNGDILQIVH